MLLIALFCWHRRVTRFGARSCFEEDALMPAHHCDVHVKVVRPAEDEILFEFPQKSVGTSYEPTNHPRRFYLLQAAIIGLCMATRII